ncbi:MAG: hypothetical protein AAFP18_18575 [Bacteroidota bacterium]
MATSLDDIASFLDARGMKYTRHSDTSIMTGYNGLERYRNPGGEDLLRLIIQIAEEGRYFFVAAPKAYVVPVEDAGPFLQACAMIQWRTKLIQFEYDASDGEVRPVIEFPLEDALLTEGQLLRCITGLTRLLEDYHAVLVRARDEGIVRFEQDEERTVEMLSQLLSGYPPELLAEALRRANGRQGGPDAKA